MAHLRCDFFSEVLGMGTSMTVLLPEAARRQVGMTSVAPDGPPPVLYLLHGLSDDCTAWTRRTSIERYAADRGLAVVMPQVERSFYLDARHGHRYGTFVAEELPRVVEHLVRVSARPEDTFVAGLSMGGYGALRWALSRPDRFAAAASLSGALDLATMQEQDARAPLYEHVFGTQPMRGTRDDLFTLVADTGAQAPPLYVACGEEDSLLRSNEAFVDRATAAGAEVRYDVGPGGHDWTYWDTAIQDVLAWLPIRTDEGTRT